MTEQRSMAIGTDPGRLAEAREWASRLAAEAGLPESDCFLVRVAVNEAVTNAIQHGSPSSSRGAIEVSAVEADGALVFEVRDGGTFVAPEVHSTDESESGRGLELLTLTMDEVHIASSPEGTVVRFAKRLG